MADPRPRRRLSIPAITTTLLAVGVLAAAVPATAGPSVSGRATQSTARTDLPARPAPIAVPVPATFFGMHRWGPSELTAQRAIVGSVRSPASEWQYVELSPGRYDWSVVDEQMRLARERGVKQVVFVLGGTPAWAAGPNGSRDPKSPISSNAPRSDALYESYVRAIATHLKGQPVAFQVWNEGNLTTFWNGTPERLARMTAKAYRIIKSINPRTPVVSASTTLRMTASYQRWFPRYLAELRRLKWPIDALSVHTYPPGTGNPLTFQGYLRTVKADLAKAGGSRLPVWITEMNYGVAGPGPKYPHRSITGTTAASWVARTYLDALRFGYARVYWYAQLDNEPSLGIRMWSGEPGMASQRTLARWLTNTTWRGCTAGRGLVVCTFTTRSATTRVAWSEGRTVAMRVPAKVTRVCTVLGACSRTRPGAILRVTGLPVRLSA